MSEPIGAGEGAMAQAQVKAVLKNAEDLGLTWTRVMATVTGYDGTTPMAIMDGDTVPIAVISMVGALFVDQRIYVDFVPPSGKYVVGIANESIGALVGWTAATGNGAFVAAETTALATGSIRFRAGGAYEIDYETGLEGSAAGNFANLQIRRTSVAGTVLRANSGHPMSSVAGFGTTCKGSAIVINTSGTDINSTAVLTIASPLAGNVRIVAAANRLAFLRARYIGAAVEYPNATVL